MKQALAFGVTAGAAVWVKQNALFLGAVPWVLVLLNGNRQALRRLPIWSGSLAFGCVAGSLLSASRALQSTSNGGWPAWSMYEVVRHHAVFYGAGLLTSMGLLSVCVLASSIAGYVYLRLASKVDCGDLHLYLAWALSGIGLHLVLRPWELRYLFLVIPALLAFSFTVWFRLAGRWLPASFAAVIFATQIAQPVRYLHGFDDAARAMAREGAHRAVFFGPRSGAFVASMREADPALRTAVLRGEKLPAELADAAQAEEFFRRYGIGTVVIAHGEADRGEDRQGTALWMRPAPSMQLLSSLPVRSSDPQLNGDIRIYRFRNPSDRPENVLRIPSDLNPSGLVVILP